MEGSGEVEVWRKLTREFKFRDVAGDDGKFGEDIVGVLICR
jgi:hypothetical protein